jgi:hypothetical protein
VESSWVHSARWPLIGLLYLPRVIMVMENLVEWRFHESFHRATCKYTTLIYDFPVNDIRILSCHWVKHTNIKSALSLPCLKNAFLKKKSMKRVASRIGFLLSSFFTSENRGATFSRNIGRLSEDDGLLHSRRQKSSWEPQILHINI